MDNYQGDLTDILRASGGASYGSSSSCSTGTTSLSELPSTSHHHHSLSHNNDRWQHQQHFSSSSSSPLSFSSVLQDPRGATTTNFGDPFSTMRDPFLQELTMPRGSSYFTAATLEEAAASFGAGTGSGSSSSGGTNINTNTNSTSTSTVFGAHNKIVEDHEMMRRPCKNIFSNMIQISPNAKLPVSLYDSSSTGAMAPSPRAIKPPAVVSPNMVNANTSKDHCLVETTPVQISSPRNPGLKRRKNQPKKVVCIPAPAAANSRQTGEIVPSDLWAWRKYGQKPIKGSPYPRGYYRCSSSKGCSARKQVERSRTDPNMLVITYTSEHNHPWPTQRNALAGSTRSQPSKNNNTSNSKNNSEGSNPQKGTATKAKEEQQHQQETNNSEGNVSPVANSVKEENMEDIEKHQLEMDEGEFSDGLTYKPCLVDHHNHQSNNNSNQSSDQDFFAELGEIEADPLDLLFTQGFGGADDHQRESKALDPFHLFDWSGDNTTTFEEPNNKRRL